jgi:hypothetical protein
MANSFTPELVSVGKFDYHLMTLSHCGREAQKYPVFSVDVNQQK